MQYRKAYFEFVYKTITSDELGTQITKHLVGTDLVEAEHVEGPRIGTLGNSDDFDWHFDTSGSLTRRKLDTSVGILIEDVLNRRRYILNHRLVRRKRK